MTSSFWTAFVVTAIPAFAAVYAFTRARHWRALFEQATQQTVDVLDRRAGFIGEGRRFDPAASLTAERERLTAMHPDWERIVNTPAFGSWVAKQSPAVGDVIRKNGFEIVNADAAAGVIAAYKASRAA